MPLHADLFGTQFAHGHTLRPYGHPHRPWATKSPPLPPSPPVPLSRRLWPLPVPFLPPPAQVPVHPRLRPPLSSSPTRPPGPKPGSVPFSRPNSSLSILLYGQTHRPDLFCHILISRLFRADPLPGQTHCRRQTICPGRQFARISPPYGCKCLGPSGPIPCLRRAPKAP
jgi:hypothetical protein